MLVGQNLKVCLCGISRYRMAIYRDGSLLESLGTSCSLSSTPSSDQTDRTLCLVRSHNTTVCLELWWWETNLLNIIIQSEWCFQFEHHNITLHNSFWYIFPFYNMFYCTKSGLESSENLRRCSTIASTSDSWKYGSRLASWYSFFKWPVVTINSPDLLRSVQWAAETIHCSFIIEPPQKNVNLRDESRAENLIATWCVIV